MAEKRMVVVDTDLLKKIDENRGDMSPAEFIDCLMGIQLGENNNSEEKEQRETLKVYATKEELRSFERDIKILLRDFLDFFITYGLELGKPSLSHELKELTGVVQGLNKEIDRDDKPKASIKYKRPVGIL